MCLPPLVVFLPPHSVRLLSDAPGAAFCQRFVSPPQLQHMPPAHHSTHLSSPSLLGQHVFAEGIADLVFSSAIIPEGVETVFYLFGRFLFPRWVSLVHHPVVVGVGRIPAFPHVSPPGGVPLIQPDVGFPCPYCCPPFRRSVGSLLQHSVPSLGVSTTFGPVGEMSFAFPINASRTTLRGAMSRTFVTLFVT